MPKAVTLVMGVFTLALAGLADLLQEGAFGVDPVLLGAGLAAILAGWAMGRLPERAVPALFALVAAGCSALMLLVAVGLDPSWIAWRAGTLVWGLPGIGIWRPDATFGYAHLEGSAGDHWHHDFRARYTIDEYGCRAVPGRNEWGPEIVVLGASYTFGHGVEDGECYPTLLETFHWPGVRMRNRAVIGWGSAHAYLALQEDLTRFRSVALVLYPWVPSIPKRNYVRLGWLETMAEYGRQHPDFELEDGRPAFPGVVRTEAGKERTPEGEETERALSIALVVEMKLLCDQAGVPFFLVALPYKRAYTERDRAYLSEYAALGIPVVDLSEMRGEHFRYDGHPTKTWHESVARALAADRQLLAVVDRARGLEPGSPAR